VKWLVVFAAGCNALFGIHELSSVPPADGPPPPIDGTTAACELALSEDFGGPAPCTDWGMVYGTDVGGTVTEGSGLLSVTPIDKAAAAAGCVSNGPFGLGPAGMSVGLASVLRGSGAYTGLQYATPGSGFAIGVVDGNLLFSDIKVDAVFASVPFDNAQPFVRLRTGGAGTMVVAERSSDGATWTPVGATPGGDGELSGQIALDASLASDASFTGPARFAFLRVCMP
jgi:hypothetical protein